MRGMFNNMGKSMEQRGGDRGMFGGMAQPVHHTQEFLVPQAEGPDQMMASGQLSPKYKTSQDRMMLAQELLQSGNPQHRALAEQVLADEELKTQDMRYPKGGHLPYAPGQQDPLSTAPGGSMYDKKFQQLSGGGI